MGLIQKRIDPLKKMVKDYKKFEKQQLEETSDAARNTRQNLPKKDMDLNTIPYVKKVCKTFASKGFENAVTLKNILSGAMVDMIHTRRQVKPTIERLKKQIRGLEQRIGSKIPKITKFYDDWNQSVEVQLNEYRSMYNKRTLELHELHRHKLFWRIFLCSLGVFIIGSSDAIFISHALQIGGGTVIDTYINSVGIALALIVLGAALGEVLKAKKSSMIWRILGGLFILLIVGFGMYTLGVFRAEVTNRIIESTGANLSTMSPLMFMTLQLMIFIAIGCIDLLFMPTHEQYRDNSKYRSKKRQLKEVSKVMNEAQRLKNNLPVLEQKEEQRLISAVNSHIEKLEVERRNFEKEITGAENTYISFLSTLESLHHWNAQSYQSVIGHYFNMLNENQEGEYFTIEDELDGIPYPYYSHKPFDYDAYEETQNDDPFKKIFNELTQIENYESNKKHLTN